METSKDFKEFEKVFNTAMRDSARDRKEAVGTLF